MVQGTPIKHTAPLDVSLPTSSWTKRRGRLLDAQSPISKGNEFRRISRFYYCLKASKKERNAGLKGLPLKRPDHRHEGKMGMWDRKGIQPQQNHHPAVKPLDLCRYLANLILPPERDTPRKLLIPYAGSGSEAIGEMMVGWGEVLGIELDPEYVEIAQRRIAHWRKGERE